MDRYVLSFLIRALDATDAPVLIIQLNSMRCHKELKKDLKICLKINMEYQCNQIF